MANRARQLHPCRMIVVFLTVAGASVFRADASTTDDRLAQMIHYDVDNPWPDPLSANADTRAWGLACYAMAALHMNTDVATANARHPCCELPPERVVQEGRERP